MVFMVPPTVNYSSPIVFLPAVWDNVNPLEGAGYCPFEIDWRTMGGPNNSVSINLANNVQSPNSMSQIVALSVDNSKCGGDVVFSFPDTQDTLTIPAFSPKVICEVFTRAIQFYVVATGAESEDVTRFLVHNVLPPPVAVPTSQEQQTAAFNDIQANTTHDTQVVPLGISGTLENVSVYYSFIHNAANGSFLWELEDGTGAVLLAGQGIQDGGQPPASGLALSLNGANLRFQNGLVFELVSAGTWSAGSAVVLNLGYRTP